MSSTDIYQLYILTLQNPLSFGIVISPRGKGLKALCVRLTRSGFNEIDHFHKEASTLGVDAREHALKRIRESANRFYCQIPFEISHDRCLVADLRESDDILRQLSNFITFGKPDDCWISR